MDTLPKNFAFLHEHDPLFIRLTNTAERVFISDPNTSLIKLRQLGEAMAQHLAAIYGIDFDERTSQADLLQQLRREAQLEKPVLDQFHFLRMEGNKATHQFQTHHREAIKALMVARNLSVWFHRTLGDNTDNFKPGAFIPPKDPSEDLNRLQGDIAQLKAQLTDANEALDSNQKLQQLLQQESQENEELALAMDEEARRLASENAAQQSELTAQERAYEEKIRALQAQLAAQSEQAQQEHRQTLGRKLKSATERMEPNEAVTRVLIDAQLRAAGWLVDTESLSYPKGARPEKGKDQAIAEWPTQLNGKKGRADYVLFAGLVPIAVVEAKKANTNVAGKIPQAERYSRGFSLTHEMEPAWQKAGRTIAWPDHDDGHYQVPFVFSGNGRAYIPQLKEASGIWFRDVREPSETARPMPEFYTPQGLLDLLQRRKEDAEQKLATESFHYLGLRPYQERAIQAVEATLAQGIRSALLAMATGTGKTRTINGLMYRFLKAERFKRLLFLVDRTALGDQALSSFKEAKLEQNQTLASIYHIAELSDASAERETRVHIATVQAMVKRVFSSNQPPPVDQYDCIIVDEAHRGYTLDQEMTEGELQTRDAAQYLSSYRRVLEFFDAVKIGLTATPAKHTSDIFGHPVYTYSYREAVADDWLIDHEPPIRYTTLLSKHGIHFDQGEQVESFNRRSQQIETSELEDDLQFEVAAFNKRVINENFNRVICRQLAQELSPTGDEKTMIFCATDAHADRVKQLLDEAFKDVYEEDYHQAAVAKITGQSPDVSDLIARYKNERYPNIAITVDLLTTGIDVPKIANLVFLRRVKSRILYEQMIGRATRRCDEMGKTVFRIYDPVDLYKTLDNVNTMKPLVKDPKITLEQLADELTDADTLQAAHNVSADCADSGVPASTQADAILDQFNQKVMRVLRKAEHKAEQNPALREKLDQLEDAWGVPPKQLHTHLKQLGPQQAGEFIQQQGGAQVGLLQQLEAVKNLLGSLYNPVISHHDDELLERTQSYGDYQRPEDYLDSFTQFIQEQVNQSAALSVVVSRPKDLTREQLREVKLLLDAKGYTEANLQTAVRDQTNQDIAASIIGHIRQAALGEALLPFGERVQQAMKSIYQLHAWNSNQRQWLDRLAKQLVHEVIVDRDFVNKRFRDNGGAKRLDKVLDQQLDTVLEALNDGLWVA